MRDIRRWLDEHGLGKYTEVFVENEIDFDVLEQITLDELKELGIPLGARKRILNAVAALADIENASSGQAPAPAEPTPPATGEAERRQLTVMFCDLVDSTALAERFDAEELGEIIRAYQDCCAGIVSRYEGYVARYMGDGILAYFGYPDAHEDDAEHSLRAGLEIIRSVPRLESRPDLSLAVRVGVTTGPVVVGETIGEGSSQEQVVVGETPNLAARLQGLAQPNTVVIGPTTRQLTAAHFEHVDLGTLELKGISEPVQAWAVSRLRDPVDTSPDTATQKLVGREQELGLLRDRWATAADGEGQVVYLSGEPGIGKSRMVEALREAVGGEKATEVLFRCSSYHRSSALYPMQEHLERVIERAPDDGALETFAKVERFFAGYRFADETTALLFAGLLGISPPEGRAPLQIPPEQQKAQTQAAVMAWMVEEAERQPLLLVWEDLHWADPSTLELVGLIIDHAPTTPMLALLVARPDFEPPWGTRSHLTPMTLTRLGKEQVKAITDGVTGGVALPTELLTQIVERADGVPLFVEELTKSIVESGVLRRVDGHYELAEALSETDIPITLQDSLMARLDRLGSAKNLAQVAAAIGRRFAYRLLRAVTRTEETTLQGELRQLIQAELIYPQGVPPQATYVFKHALIQDVAYETLLRRRREALHGAIGEAIEAVEGERAEGQAAVLAHHYARSAHREKAIRYALQAGDDAVRLHARAEATTHYGQALAIAQELADSVDAQGSQIDAIVKLASVGSSREEGERDAQNLEQAESMAQTLNDQPRLARVLYWRARLFYVSGDLRTAHTYAKQSLSIADRLGDGALAAWPVNLMGRLSFHQGDFSNASQLMVRSAEQMLALGNATEEAAISAFAAVSLACLGEFETAFAHVDRGIVLARELQNPFTEAAALQYRGYAHSDRGNWSSAIADLEASRRIADEVGDAFRAYMSKGIEGYCHTMSGRPVRGRALTEEALAYAHQIGTTFYLAAVHAYHARCLIALGDYEGAEKFCREATESPEAEAQGKVCAHHALAQALHAQDLKSIEPAENAVREAMALARAVRYQPELARSSLSYARMLQDWGRHQEAERHLNEAIALFRDMGMEWDLAQAEQVRAN